MNLKERNDNMREFFNSKIEEYDGIHLQMMDNKNKITELLNDDTFKVLDLGAGTGLELIPFFKRFPNADVTVIDITENMLEELKKREFAKSVKTICGDFFKVDFGKEYDAIISSAALHHFNKEDKLLLYTKIYKSLKNGGQFINSDRYANSIEEENKLMNEYVENPNLYKHMDTPLAVDTELEILKDVGFKNICFINLDDEKYKVMYCEK